MQRTTTNHTLQLNYAEQGSIKRASTLFKEQAAPSFGATSASDYLSAKKAAAIAASVTSPLSDQGAVISGLRQTGC
jgi:hypothetical protein